MLNLIIITGPKSNVTDSGRNEVNHRMDHIVTKVTQLRISTI